MGQYEILELLKNDGGWMDTRQVSDAIGKSFNGTGILLRKLVRWNLVEKRLKSVTCIQYGKRQDLEFRISKNLFFDL